MGLNASDRVLHGGAEIRALYVRAGIGIEVLLPYSGEHGKYSTIDKKKASPWVALRYPIAVPNSPGGAVFDVVGLWLLYCMARESTVLFPTKFAAHF